jgi:sec-independent protein translocase protein TatB
MFDIGASELLLTIIVAIVVIGPKDMPRALRTAGSWLGKIRRVSGHFRSGIEEMIRQAELQEMEQKWREQNAAILEAHPAIASEGSDPAPDASAEAALPPADGDSTVQPDAKPSAESGPPDPGAPELPLEQRPAP